MRDDRRLARHPLKKVLCSVASRKTKTSEGRKWKMVPLTTDIAPSSLMNTVPYYTLVRCSHFPNTTRARLSTDTHNTSCLAAMHAHMGGPRLTNTRMFQKMRVKRRQCPHGCNLTWPISLHQLNCLLLAWEKDTNTALITEFCKARYRSRGEKSCARMRENLTREKHVAT